MFSCYYIGQTSDKLSSCQEQPLFSKRFDIIVIFMTCPISYVWGKSSVCRSIISRMWTQVPFADRNGFVAQIVEKLRHDFMFQRKRIGGCPNKHSTLHASMDRMQPYKKMHIYKKFQIMMLGLVLPIHTLPVIRALRLGVQIGLT